MKVLFISSDNLMAAHLAYLMKNEGCDVRLFIDDPDRKDNFTNIVAKTENWKNDLEWVGKDGLIVFDDIGYGKVQDDLRKQGYSVFGGSELGDRLETDREYAQEVFAKYGIKTVPLLNFKNADDAIQFVRNNPNAWVIKQNDHASKSLNYVGHFGDGRDVINVLENYKTHVGDGMGTISLQQKIDGVEIGVARYFNGNDWVGPIEINVEHKKFFPGDLGPATSEMGTLGWYDDNENNKIFVDTLGKLKPHLQEIGFKGDIDINCIVNETGAYPLEATPRFGSPMIYLHAEIHSSPWHKFLKAIADGMPYDLNWKRGYGMVVLVTLPPFPYAKKMLDMSPKGINIYFDDSMSTDDMSHVHFEGVAAKNIGNKLQYYISDYQGYVLYVTAVEQTVGKAKESVQKIIDKIYIPKMIYRHDIGDGFMQESYQLLKQWKYI